MSRDLTSGMIGEVTAAALRPVVLVKAEFDSGDLLLWSGIGQITHNGDIYTGAGNLLNISEVSETTSIEAQGATFVLSGIPSAIISLALNEDYQGRAISMYFGCLSDLGALVADPVLMFKGTMDVVQIDDSGDTATVSVQAENRLIDLRRSMVRRYTPEDQKQDFPADKGLDFVAGLQEKEIVWGKK